MEKEEQTQGPALKQRETGMFEHGKTWGGGLGRHAPWEADQPGAPHRPWGELGLYPDNNESSERLHGLKTLVSHLLNFGKSNVIFIFFVLQKSQVCLRIINKSLTYLQILRPRIFCS